MEIHLRGKKILITGGTSRLGRAFVLQALTRGADTFFTYHQSGETAAELIEKGAAGFRVNLGRMREIESLAKEFKTRSGSLDILIHNAASTRDKLLRDMTEEDWDHVLEVGLKAPYYLTKKLLPLLFKSERAKVLMITSRTAYHGTAGAANYAAAKAGLIGLTKSLASELGRKRILVNAVNPGFMISGMTESLSGEVKGRHRGLHALDVFSDPDEVAEFLCYLCSDGARQVTGQVFHWEGRNIACL